MLPLILVNLVADNLLLVILYQKDKIKIVFNKQTITSIKKVILDKIFSDFEILGQLHYDKYYNFFINTNAKYITKKIKKEYLKIIKKI